MTAMGRYMLKMVNIKTIYISDKSDLGKTRWT